MFCVLSDSPPQNLFLETGSQHVAEADLELMIPFAPCLEDQGNAFPHLDRLFAIEEKEASY